MIYAHSIIAGIIIGIIIDILFIPLFLTGIGIIIGIFLVLIGQQLLIKYDKKGVKNNEI